MKNKHKLSWIENVFMSFINKCNNYVSILNKQVELLEIWNVEKYDEEFFTTLFDFTNKIKIKNICIQFNEFLSNKDVKNICAKIYNNIRSLKTQNIIFNEVSFFIKLI